MLLSTVVFAALEDGDIILLNDPYISGTHLPDLTLIAPVYLDDELLGYAANKAHHTDVGGKAPGSIAGDSTELYQEGLIIPPVRFVHRGRIDPDIASLIRSNVRTPETQMGDLRAQIAAGNVGKLRIESLFDDYGKELVLETIKQLMDYAEALTRKELERIPDGSYTFVDYMDNDGVDLDKTIAMKCKVTIRGSEFTADFTGTSPQVKGPFNMTPSSTLS